MKCKKCGYAITVVNKPAGMRRPLYQHGEHKPQTRYPGRGTVVTLEQIEEAVRRACSISCAALPCGGPQTQRAVPTPASAGLRPPSPSRKTRSGQLTRNLARSRDRRHTYRFPRRSTKTNHALSELEKRQRDALLYTHPQDDLSRFPRPF